MIYLDHAATTPVFSSVFNAMSTWYMADHVGNPGSIHTQGVLARKAIEKARTQVAKMINASPAEIFFTSGGTESNNIWIQCIGDSTIFLTSVEHDSVLEPVFNAKGHGMPIHIAVTPSGCMDVHDLEAKLAESKEYHRAVTAMWVNNELGTENPIKEIGELCRQYGALFHVDAVQAAGHVPIDVQACNIDFLSMSGHKFGAPLGVGVLYIRSSIQKHPFILGGGQESGIRGGTENVSGIVGIGEAAELVSLLLPKWRNHWAFLREAFIKDLHGYMEDGIRVNGDPNNTCSSIISLTIPGVNSEALLMMLDQRGVYLSAGSACSAASSESSHVLRGVGMPDEEASCTIRVSMGFDTTLSEMRSAAAEIVYAVSRIKSMYPQ